MLPFHSPVTSQREQHLISEGSCLAGVALFLAAQGEPIVGGARPFMSGRDLRHLFIDSEHRCPIALIALHRGIRNPKNGVTVERRCRAVQEWCKELFGFGWPLTFALCPIEQFEKIPKVSPLGPEP